jgi:AAA15 family ATPase/GTPase
MIKSLTIKNFRCFRNLSVGPLERVNLIAGTNNVGKTSLLEALYVLENSRNGMDFFPDNPLRDTKQLAAAKSILDATFFEKHNDSTIQITGAGQNDEIQEVQGKFTADLVARERLIDLTYSKAVGSELSPNGNARYNETSGSRGGSVPLPSKIAIFGSSPKTFDPPIVEQFSKLEEVGRQDEILSALQILDPRLKKLSVLISNNVALIHGDIGIARLIPLQLMGEAVVRLTMFLIGIANVQGGIALVDEIENGFHYSVMSKVWEAIARAARESDVQLFATTHSWECIRAAHEAFSASEQYDFRLHRLDRDKKTDGITSVTYDKETLEAAITAGFEVR